MKESGSSETFFTLFSPNLTESRFSPSLSEVRCWKMEMRVPWNDDVAVVAVGLWSMLSIAAVVNSPFLRGDGQITPSAMYLLMAASPS